MFLIISIYYLRNVSLTKNFTVLGVNRDRTPTVWYAWYVSKSAVVKGLIHRGYMKIYISMNPTGEMKPTRRFVLLVRYHDEYFAYFVYFCTYAFFVLLCLWISHKCVSIPSSELNSSSSRFWTDFKEETFAFWRNEANNYSRETWSLPDVEHPLQKGSGKIGQDTFRYNLNESS